jgi:gamma-glutamyltranspeptidase/glutathione hydrolase
MGWYAAGSRGAVAAGGADAVSAGVAVLRSGGNAIDAAVATILALSVTDYGLFAIGGEASFILYNAARREVKVLCGLGSAPGAPEAVKWYLANGIPAYGGIKAAPVPGAPDLCFTALRLYGTISLEAAAAPALCLLERGAEPWHASLARTIGRLVEAERQASGGRERRLLAARDRFYTGDIAGELEEFYASGGSFLRKADLAAHVARLEDPVSVRYRGYTVHKCGPWTQGPSLCQALRLLEGFDLKRMGHLSADYVHVVVEAMKLALADRDEYYADPLFARVPLGGLLSDRYTDLRRGLIDPRRASTAIRPGDPNTPAALICNPRQGGPWTGGTTTCVVADRWGNVVAATPSANPPYAVCEALGVAHGNRLRCLNVNPSHPNCIQPGKRPRITLTPTLVVGDDGAVLAMSVAGGDMQDQTSLNCLLNHVEFGMMPRDAVTAPRFGTAHHQNSFRPDADREQTVLARGSLMLDGKLGEALAQELSERGHAVSRAQGPIACPVMLHLDAATGLAHVAGDPRAGRHAQALD